MRVGPPPLIQNALRLGGKEQLHYRKGDGIPRIKTESTTDTHSLYLSLFHFCHSLPSGNGSSAPPSPPYHATAASILGCLSGW